MSEANIVGVETRSLCSAIGRVPFSAVLVLGENNDLACYVGADNPNAVAMNGDKVTLQEACCYFPLLLSHMKANGLSYRGPAGDLVTRLWKLEAASDE